MQRLDLREQRRDEGDARDLVEAEEAGAQPVVRVVRAIGDVVGERGALRLEAGEAFERGEKRGRTPRHRGAARARRAAPLAAHCA